MSKIKMIKGDKVKHTISKFVDDLKAEGWVVEPKKEPKAEAKKEEPKKRPGRKKVKKDDNS